MKIGIEAQRIFREHKHGMDFVALEMIRHLQKIDHDNQYVIFVSEGPDVCLEETANFKIVRFKAPYPIWEQLLLPFQVKKHGCDLLHCTSNTAPVRCSIPVIVTIHDIIYFESNPLWSQGYSLYQRFGNFYRRLVVRQNLKTADLIITVSQFEGKRLEKVSQLSKSRLKVIYNGVGEHFKPAVNKQVLSEIREKYDLPEKYFLFLGNTDPKKNTANTVKAFANFCKDVSGDYKLVVADLDVSVIRRFLAETNDGHLLDRIEFTGYIANSDLPGVLEMAEIFLYPSKRESFGIPILEAMAVGTPVVTSSVASMPEVSGEAAMLVDPENIHDISRGLQKLVTDQEFRENMVKKGFNRVKDFSWRNTAKEVLDIYKLLFKSQ